MPSGYWSGQKRSSTTDMAQGQSTNVWEQLRKTPFVCYSPAEIKLIRNKLGETQEEFAQRFFVSTEAVRAWESPEASPKHRECLGAAAKLMWWTAQEANERGCVKGNLIRLAVGYVVGGGR